MKVLNFITDRLAMVFLGLVIMIVGIISPVRVMYTVIEFGPLWKQRNKKVCDSC